MAYLKRLAYPKSSWLLILITTSLIGCAHQSNLYYWGNYEELIYDIYTNPGTTPATVQIEKLTTDIQIAHSKGLQVPPGVYAHLGTVYASEGDINNAMAAFNMEKTLYPESIHFINGMLNRARGQGDE